MNSEDRQMCGPHCRASALRRGSYVFVPLERVFVSAVVVALLGVCRRVGGSGTWFLGPFILTVGAMLPTLLHRDGRLSDLGFQVGRTRRDVWLLVMTCAGMLALGFAGVFVLKHLSIEPPARISIPTEGLPLWILFQFMYVALPEELFFRGYILSNGMKLRQEAAASASSLWIWANQVFSAGLFALSHVLVSGEAASSLTFLPGLIFAWIYVRVGSLVPLVLLHGAANIGYALVLETIV